MPKLSKKTYVNKNINQNNIGKYKSGINFIKLKTKTSQTFIKAINKLDTFKISSYELKKEINTDYELKKHFFRLYLIQVGLTMDT